MDADRRNDTGIFRYTDVEYTPEGHTDAYRRDDFLGIAGGHVYSAMDTIDMVSTGGQYEGDEPEHAYACEIVGCCGLSDGVALFRPVSHDGADLIQIAFLRNDVDDATGAYTERFEAGSFDLPAADLPRSEFGVDLLEYFSGRSFKYTPGVSRGLDPREAVDSIEDAIGCDLELFDGFWLGVPGEADMRVGPYTKKSLLDFSYYAKELSCRYGFADSDILEIARHLPDECPDCLAAVKAYLDCEYVPDGNAPDAISQAVRCGSPVNGLHFYHGDEPKPAPEFFKPAKVKGGKSPAAMAAAAKAAAGNGCASVPDGMQRNRLPIATEERCLHDLVSRKRSLELIDWDEVDVD